MESSGRDDGTSITQANKAVVRRFVEEIYNRDNLDIIDELTTPDFVDHNVRSGTSFGLGERKRALTAFHHAFPGLKLTIDDLFGEGDRVALRGTFRGAQAAPIFGIPPTGKHVTVTGVMIARLVDGKIAESWLHYDVQGLLEQLGAVAPLDPLSS